MASEWEARAVAAAAVAVLGEVSVRGRRVRVTASLVVTVTPALRMSDRNCDPAASNPATLDEPAQEWTG